MDPGFSLPLPLVTKEQLDSQQRKKEDSQVRLTEGSLENPPVAKETPCEYHGPEE